MPTGSSLLPALVAGGAAGYFLFFWLAKQNFYGLVLPGAGIGLGCELFSRGRSNARACLRRRRAAIGAIAEWQFARSHDDSLGYFLTHSSANCRPLP